MSNSVRMTLLLILTGLVGPAVALAAECDAVLRQGRQPLAACTKRDCDVYAMGGRQEDLRRHSACMDRCARAVGPEYQRCYSELMTEANAAGLAPMPTAVPGVSADCFAGEMSITCHRGRVEDAKELVRIFEPAVGRAGWTLGCIDVEYVRGDVGKADVIMVILHGPKRSQAPACRNLPYEPNPGKAAARAAGATVLKMLGEDLKKALSGAPPSTRGRLLRSVSRIELGDGWGGGATVKL